MAGFVRRRQKASQHLHASPQSQSCEDPGRESSGDRELWCHLEFSHAHRPFGQFPPPPDRTEMTELKSTCQQESEVSSHSSPTLTHTHTQVPLKHPVHGDVGAPRSTQTGHARACEDMATLLPVPGRPPWPSYRAVSTRSEQTTADATNPSGPMRSGGLSAPGRWETQPVALITRESCGGGPL